MANVPTIKDFADSIDIAINALCFIREDIKAADRLWLALTTQAKSNIHNQVATSLVVAQELVAALVVP